MLRQIIGKKTIERDQNWLDNLTQNKRVVVDLGTGDARFAYNYAKTHPSQLVLAIDADAQSMQETSAKAGKKPEKGGLSNLICIWAAAESLPPELNGTADHIFINFPWGSLLGGVAKVEELIMNNISNLAKKGAELEINLTYHQAYEPKVVEELDLPELNEVTLTDWQKKCAPFGWEFLAADKLTDEQITSLSQSWAKRITSQRQREVWRIKFRKD